MKTFVFFSLLALGQVTVTAAPLSYPTVIAPRPATSNLQTLVAQAPFLTPALQVRPAPITVRVVTPVAAIPVRR